MLFFQFFFYFFFIKNNTTSMKTQVYRRHLEVGYKYEWAECNPALTETVYEGTITTDVENNRVNLGRGKVIEVRYYTENPCEYVGRFVKETRTGYGDGGMCMAHFVLDDGTEKTVKYSYEGTTCFRRAG